ncbi:site-specific integrase [Clostridium botulinum]|uniref:tyrosine-type recombinase/integrase n=1 Tax=Clostridium botulinum TaxID=1491 RepID=UPI000774DD64|nr:site-specific integrase [Clostridium botulinum]NFH81363.1 site-specific integrase [Clostridium botulinum]NFH84853.1 site-specific integrase [Clostridium botulinum]NFI12505.1 site-specific integrase [Clostridium botulinum]NFI15388.1 site-specific integrase [Clostridium botulinum]NFO85123.1 site-specific integrase [Clostridium botulinum]
MRKLTCKTNEKCLEDGYNKFVEYAKANNYRKDSIIHYYYTYNQITKIIDGKTLLRDINIDVYNTLTIKLIEKGIKNVTLKTYLKTFKTIINYCIKNGYVEHFVMELPKVDQKTIETYSDEELKILLRKPNMKTCIFTEYRDWVIINFLLSTGVRLSSLANIKIEDIDFDTSTINITHTKNRKALIVPLNNQILTILKEYLYQRGGDKDEILFCTIWGKPLTRNSLGTAIRHYNNSRGVTTTGIHRFRHTFAKKWVLNGNNIVALQKILGHSSLDMTQKYINVLVSDLNKEVNNYNILQEFSTNYIKMKKNKKK